MADVKEIRSMSHKEQSGLLISFDSLLNEVEILYQTSSGEAHKAYSRVLDIIVDMAVKRTSAISSSWEIVKVGTGCFDYYSRCKHCHGNTPDKAYAVAPDFCPNCGADMRGD